MPFVHRPRSHLSDFVFSACSLVNNHLYQNIKDFSGVFLLWLSVCMYMKNTFWTNFILGMCEAFWPGREQLTKSWYSWNKNSVTWQKPRTNYLCQYYSNSALARSSKYAISDEKINISNPIQKTTILVSTWYDVEWSQYFAKEKRYLNSRL